ncbi:MAG: NUDIX hydrolase [Lachnospiraceae bacterium]|nr:NUDIX hydrolase [Lachnospiraceae bacterium]
MSAGERLSIRNVSPQALKVLLVKRKSYPYKEWWALPGGFCVPGESVYDTARRELLEETGVADAFLEAVDVYGEKGRDPRGWIISSTFMALINGEEYRLHAGSDAWEARWFSVDVEEIEKQSQPEEVFTRYLLKLYSDDVTLQAEIAERKTFRGCHALLEHTIEMADGLAFDHGKILLETILKLRQKAKKDVTLLFDLLPERFTILRAQSVYECLLHKELIGPNFRRKIMEYVQETDILIEGEGFRPAKLFERNLEKIMEGES